MEGIEDKVDLFSVTRGPPAVSERAYLRDNVIFASFALFVSFFRDSSLEKSTFICLEKTLRKSTLLSYLFSD